MKKKVKVGDIVSCDDFSWNVEVTPMGLRKNDKQEKMGKKIRENVTVIALSTTGFPTSDHEGNISSDPEKMCKTIDGNNSFGTICSAKLNDMMVQTKEGTIYFLRTDLIPEKGTSELKEQLEAKKGALDKWQKVIYTINTLHNDIASPCGFCTVYAEGKYDQFKKYDCPLMDEACHGCNGMKADSFYFTSLSHLERSKDEADKMRDAIEQEIRKCEKELEG